LEDRFGYKYSWRWACVGFLFAFIAIFRLSSIMALKVLNFQNR
jgi:hypothetical protein